MSREMVNSGIPWIGDIPKEWCSHRIKNHFSIISGSGFDVNLQGMEQGDLPVCKASDISRAKKYITTAENYLSKEVALSQKFNIIPIGSIIFPKIGEAMKKNRRAICAVECCVDNNCQALVPNEINNIYSYYLLCCIKMEWYDNAGTIPSISNQKLRIENIPFPSLSEQQRIASFLDKKCAEVDEMIALQEKIIEELKAYKQSVITEAVTKGLNPNVPMKESGIEWIGQIPAHWEVKRLKFAVERRSQKVTDENFQYIGLENIESFSGRFIETNNEYDISQAFVCSEGDVIFGKLRPYLGKVMVIKSNQCCSSEFIVFKGGDSASYLRYLILSDWFIEIVNSSTYGTKMPRANPDFIMNMEVVFPSASERKSIADYIDTKCTEIDNLISIKQQKIEHLKEYKKSIIYEYVTGKKEVEE